MHMSLFGPEWRGDKASLRRALSGGLAFEMCLAVLPSLAGSFWALAISLPQRPRSWDYRSAALHRASSSFREVSIVYLGVLL